MQRSISTKAGHIFYSLYSIQLICTVVPSYIEREITRKKHLADLSTRTEAELAEEEALAVELKRLEQTERAFALARDDLLRRLAGIESGLPGIAAQSERDEEARERMLVEARTGGGPIPGSAGATMGTSGARKRKQSQAQATSAGLDLESPLSSVPPGSAGLMLAPPGTPTRRFGGGQGSAYGKSKCILLLSKLNVNASSRCNTLHPPHRRTLGFGH